MDESASHRPRHTIQVVVRRTGVSADALRAWERRYGAVVPGRSETGRRLYSDDDIERVALLGRLTRAGHRIGDVATSSLPELKALCRDDDAANPLPPRRAAEGDVSDRLEASLDAVHRMDPVALEKALDEASVAMTGPALLDGLLSPLLRRIGAEWQHGEIRPAQEHVATAVIRTFMACLQRAHAGSGSGPVLVAGTPSGERHELGALASSLAASMAGWQVVYLGPDLPAEDIASVVLAKDARAVALSIIDPCDESVSTEEIRRLARILPDDVSLFVGGTGARTRREALIEAGATYLDSMADFRRELETLRAAAA